MLLTRVRDTVKLENRGEGRVRGAHVPAETWQYFRYYDELGVIFHYKKHNGLNVLGFRYPLYNGERIELTVDRISLGARNNAPIFGDSLCLKYRETRRSLFGTSEYTSTEARAVYSHTGDPEKKKQGNKAGLTIIQKVRKRLLQSAEWILGPLLPRKYSGTADKK